MFWELSQIWDYARKKIFWTGNQQKKKQPEFLLREEKKLKMKYLYTKYIDTNLILYHCAWDSHIEIFNNRYFPVTIPLENALFLFM